MFRSYLFILYAAIWYGALPAAAAGEPKPASGEKREGQVPIADPYLHEFPQAGYRVIIPEGYKRISHDDSKRREKDLVLLLQTAKVKLKPSLPPLYFRKKRDTQEALAPISFKISFSSTPMAFRKEDLKIYGDAIARHFTEKGPRPKSMNGTLLKVQGKEALRTDLAFPAGKDGRRFRSVFMVPGHDRTFEITFFYDTRQRNEAERDMEALLKTFAFEGALMGQTDSFAPAPEAPPGAIDWWRVGYWTGGCFVAGVLLHFLLQALQRRFSGKRSPPNGGKLEQA